MYKINISEYEVNTNKNRGTNKEWTLCEYYGIHRTAHDSVAYNVGSDIEIDEMNISVKSSGATLMSGKLSEGCKTFEGIWRRYRKNVHSNTFVYVTNEFTAYFMNINEFSKFIHSFAYLDRESQKNGGQKKIKIRGESRKMVKWLEERVA